MAAKKKKTRKPAKRKAAKKSAKKKVAAKRKSAPKRKPAAKKKRKPVARAKAIAKKLAPTVETMKAGAVQVGQGALDAGRLLFDEAKSAGKEAEEKVKDVAIDWYNRGS
jgi:hypothetical protein